MDSLWKIWTTSHRWKNIDPEHISLAKRGAVAYLGNYSGQSVQQHAMYCSLIPGRTQHSVSAYIVQSLQRTHVSNAAWGRWGAHEKQSFIFLDMQLWTPLMSLVVTDFLSCGWPIVRTNFSEWVQIFQKNSFRGEPILGGSTVAVSARATGYLWIFNRWRNRMELGQLSDSRRPGRGGEAVCLDRWLRGRKYHTEEIYYDTGVMNMRTLNFGDPGSR